MAGSPIWLSPPHLNGNEESYLSDALRSNWLTTSGKYLDRFERDLSCYTGRSYGVALASGTAALHLALIRLGIGADDVVLCQSLTFVASANPILYQSAIPAFIDSEPDTWNMCPHALEEAIQYFIRKGKKPKAIIAVHLYGMPAKIDELMRISLHYEIPLVEDAAEALGSSYKGRMAGSFGRMSVISFNGNKIITTSGGGALLSENQSDVDNARFLSTQAKENAPFYQHLQVGYNYRMSNLSAALGCAQLECIGQRVERRQRNYSFYKEYLGNLNGVQFQPEPEQVRSNRWLSVIVLHSGIDPAGIIIRMQQVGIETRRIWKPLHLQPLFAGAPYFGGDQAEKLFVKGLCLPSGSALSQPDLFRITERLTDLLS